VRAWAAKYRDLGLVVSGVHTPEFPFERKIEDVREAAQAMRVQYLIALDSDYGSGAPSPTGIGRPSTSQMQRTGSGITASARATKASG
jgi:hypothetical protein